ncbi:MAG TPA: HAMP domain-containing sensor histidine kinase [Kofleriaceae bacterium]|nr:HAMP domain-containing sensor histidine kinase [Kofleriaceae bacterium]
MTTKRDPQERSSTDEGLRSERKKTDAELAARSKSLLETTAGAISDARGKADSVLNQARDREDVQTGASTQVSDARAHEDAIIRAERLGADADTRDEVELQRIALASLLAFERKDTDLRLNLERKRADQVLASREDFMAMVSHDLRSLLGGIALSADLLKGVERSEQPFVKVTHYAERIQRFSARMTRLVGDLVDVVSIDAGKLSLVRARYDVEQLLRDAHDAFEPAATAEGVELTCTPEGNLGSVELDHQRILQVLTNLVGNALKFTERGGTIIIRAKRLDDAIGFSVSDTGSGIPTELLEKVFDRYFQSEGGDPRGLGLGLYISKSIIDAHGGRIWATSTPGKGTSIFFTVPPLPVAS